MARNPLSSPRSLRVLDSRQANGDPMLWAAAGGAKLGNGFHWASGALTFVMASRMSSVAMML